MIKRKAKILIGALELLEEGGINNVTTKNMAKQQGVSEPALYRQYKGKLEIIEGIIDEYASFDEQIRNTIVDSKIKGREALEFYVSRYAELYRNYSEITTVMFSMDVYYYKDSTKQMMIDIQSKRLEFLKKLIEEGQNEGLIRKIWSPEVTAETLDGIIFAQIYRWRMNDKKAPVDEQLLSVIGELI